MKLHSLTLAFMMLTNINAFAKNAQESVSFQNGDTSKLLNLEFEVTEKGSREVHEKKICSREVQIGTFCKPIYLSNKRAGCIPNMPKYKTETYSCTETATIPYEIHKHNIFSNVNLSLKDYTDGNFSNLNCNAILNNEDLVVSSKLDGNNENNNVVVFGNIQNKKIKNLSNKDKLIDISYEIKLFDKSKYYSPISNKIKNLKIDKSNLTFVIGKVFYPEWLKVKLNVKKDTVSEEVHVANGVLKKEMYEISPINESSSLIKIKLDRLNLIFDKNQKYVFYIKIKLLAPGAVINDEMNFSDFELSEKIRSQINY